MTEERVVERDQVEVEVEVVVEVGSIGVEQSYIKPRCGAGSIELTLVWMNRCHPSRSCSSCCRLSCCRLSCCCRLAVVVCCRRLAVVCLVAGGRLGRMALQGPSDCWDRLTEGVGG